MSRKQSTKQNTERPRCLTREQILAAPDGDDRSRDWRKWSCNKQERERHRIPELDAKLSGIEADFERGFASHAALMRGVFPEYKRGDRISATRVYARLAVMFNMSPLQVRELSVEDIAALALEFASPKAGAETPTDNATAYTVSALAEALECGTDTIGTYRNLANIPPRKHRGDVFTGAETRRIVEQCSRASTRKLANSAKQWLKDNPAPKK